MHRLLILISLLLVLNASQHTLSQDNILRASVPSLTLTSQEVQKHEDQEPCETHDQQPEACKAANHCYWFKSVCLPDCESILDRTRCTAEALCTYMNTIEGDSRQTVAPSNMICRPNCMIQPLFKDPSALDCTLCLTETACRRATSSLSAHCLSVYLPVSLPFMEPRDEFGGSATQRLRNKGQHVYACIHDRPEENSFLTTDDIRRITKWINASPVGDSRTLPVRPSLSGQKLDCRVPEREHLQVESKWIPPGKKVKVSCAPGYVLTGSSEPEMQCGPYGYELVKGQGIRCVAEAHFKD